MLIAAPDRWDEACFSVPAVRAIGNSGLDIGILCPARQEEFWKSIPGIHVIPHPQDSSAKTIARDLSSPWKASLAWEPGPPAEALARLKIPRRLGPKTKPLTKQLTHPILPNNPPGPLDHRVRHYLALAETLGIDCAKPEFFTPAPIGIPPEPNTVLICPDSDFGSNHEWPLDRWLELTHILKAHGQKITIAGLPEGRHLGQSLAQSLGPDHPYFNARPLAGALPIFAVHNVVIAADGSLPHLAAHAGSTCITLFGPNDPNWKRPLGRRHHIVRHHVECAPCFLAKCPLDLRCQNELTIHRVLSHLGLKNPLAPTPKIGETPAPA